jgi:hypothetical protein
MSRHVVKITTNALWRIVPLQGKDLEANNETTAVAIQRRGKHASTTRDTVGNGVFCSARQRSYLEDNWGDPVSCQLLAELSSAREAVKIGSEREKLNNLHC